MKIIGGVAVTLAVIAAVGAFLMYEAPRVVKA